jgi:hypothetical protein
VGSVYKLFLTIPKTYEKLVCDLIPERETFMELYQKVNVQALLAAGNVLAVSELKDFKEHAEIRERLWRLYHSDVFLKVFITKTKRVSKKRMPYIYLPFALFYIQCE